jgi:hypothetical protein
MRFASAKHKNMTGRTHSVLRALVPWAIVVAAFLVIGLSESFVELVLRVVGL